MVISWGPHYIVPTKALKDYSGIVKLREEYDEDLLHKELDSLEISGPILRVNNPWYCRKKGKDTWVKIGESDNKDDNFSVKWDTETFPNGIYEILGMMHVHIKQGEKETAIARTNIVEVEVKN